MDRKFHVTRPFVEPRADPFLELDGRQAQHDPDEYDSDDNFDNGTQIHRILPRVKRMKSSSATGLERSDGLFFICEDRNIHVKAGHLKGL
jgi:hypothetical protein